MPIKPDRFWEQPTDGQVPSGLTKRQISDWEAQIGIALPKVLKPLFQVQNGGAVQYSDIQILPLEKIAPVETDFWTDAEYSRKLIADTSLVFRFAADRRRGDHHYFLNFNAKGRDGEPSVYHLYHDPGELRLFTKTVKAFFDKLIGVTDSPLADWSETERLETVLHQESMEWVVLGNLAVLQKTLLGRLNGNLFWYSMTDSGDTRSVTKVTLPEPLDKSWAMIRPTRPSPKMYGLHLQPCNSDGIVSIESKQRDDGFWKNEIDHGVPHHITVESTSLERLEQLKRTLFGS